MNTTVFLNLKSYFLNSVNILFSISKRTLPPAFMGLILIASASLFFVACNGNGSTTKGVKTTDSASLSNVHGDDDHDKPRNDSLAKSNMNDVDTKGGMERYHQGMDMVKSGKEMMEKGQKDKDKAAMQRGMEMMDKGMETISMAKTMMEKDTSAMANKPMANDMDMMDKGMAMADKGKGMAAKAMAALPDKPMMDNDIHMGVNMMDKGMDMMDKGATKMKKDKKAMPKKDPPMGDDMKFIFFSRKASTSS